MTAVEELLALQDLDLALDQLRHRRDHLPERGELGSLEKARADLERQLAEVEAVRTDLAGRRAGTEAELAATEDRAAAIDKRLYGGEVRASRDLQAMAAELEQTRSRASALEDAVLELLEASEPLDARAAELSGSLASLAAARADATARLAEAEQAIDAETARVGSPRSETAARVPEALLATYERLRGRLGGVGVARVVGNHCDGCHLTLSAVELDHLRHLSDGEVYTCEQCGRILVP
jgi:hypothetical protein